MNAQGTFEVAAQLCDGLHPLAYPGILRLSQTRATSLGDGFERSYAREELRASPRIVSARRFIALPDGAEIECADAAWLDWLPQQERSEGLVAWLEQRWSVALGAVALTALSLILGYFFALDAVSNKLASAIPVARERAFGEHSLRSLDGRLLLQRSGLTEERKQAVVAGFARFCAQMPDGSGMRLEFRSSKALGANALTLPGGIIVVTDQLVLLMPSDDQVLAVLAHELGHAHYRHVLRQAVKSSGSAVTTGVLLGDASSVAGGLSSAMVLLNTQYSREFERQADDYAADLLRKNQLSPEVFADALVALDDEQQRLGEQPGYPFLSTHPGSQARIARARLAASASPAASK